ncbi:hypothetical protein ACJVDH_00225 [Pedobacter sp. AW1-32]|uniref:hypothetical protein n=1 Tax=Pedobacter sp. AW1-32 TaxID=3383026 RepID=UPI003FF0F2CF
MAQNKMIDLNNHLFAQLERLNDETIKPEKMEMEIKKAKAVSQVASQIIKSNALVLKAVELQGKGLIKDAPDNFGVKAIS